MDTSSGGFVSARIVVTSTAHGRLALWTSLVLVAMNALYAYGAFGGGSDLFGIDALRGLGGARYALSMAVAFAAAAALAVVDPRFPVERPAVAVAIALLCWPVFFMLRGNVLNQDGNMLAPKFAADVPRVGAHLTHDELLELFLHSRVWYYSHRWWDWSVVFSYRVVSCVAGSAFVFGMLRLARRLAPARVWLFLAGVLSGGYMQLFFGDAENYTMTAALVVFYLLSSSRFLAGEVGLWLPTLVLAIAMCFHLEAGWLAPTWLYLCLVSRDRRSDLNEAATSAAIGAAVVIATFVYFHFNGLPLERFFSSHAGHALRMNGVFAIGMPLGYYVEQLNLLLLLCPAVAMIVPILAGRYTSWDETSTFLGIGVASMLLFQAIWKAQLGVYDDWNLYAMGGMVTAIFIWRSLAAAAETREIRITAAALAAVGGLHTYAWILSNHRG